MRTTVNLDDELLAKAQAFTGLKQKSVLLREALSALIERESARRLARLGGSEPAMTAYGARPRRPIDAKAMQEHIASMPLQPESAETFVRAMRDDDRF